MQPIGCDLCYGAALGQVCTACGTPIPDRAAIIGEGRITPNDTLGAEIIRSKRYKDTDGDYPLSVGPHLSLPWYRNVPALAKGPEPRWQDWDPRDIATW